MYKKLIPKCPVGLLLVCLLLGVFPLFADTRSFNVLFPNLPSDMRNAVFSNTGYIKVSEKASGYILIGGDGAYDALDPQIKNAVLGKNPGYLIESLMVIPETSGAITLLDIYNALGNIRNLKGRLYRSVTRNENIPLFEDATRLESAKKNTPVPDPRPASSVPRSETVFIRLKDVNFGNSYYRGDMMLDQYGLRYCLSNNKNLTYLFIPVIKEEKFIAQFYFEIIQEGVLIYSITGVDASDFIASKIDIGSAISKRLAVIISWVADGIGKTK
ncbi:hypothetical protein AGMMS50293_02880 [Spirochaetia bacterium]|nr:hypothetical protein AGMMS50293_02880 [Spirochaetia bacterium]